MGNSYRLDSLFLIGTVENGEAMIVSDEFFPDEAAATTKMEILQQAFPFMPLQPIRMHMVKINSEHLDG